MTAFDDRKDAFEKKYAHDQELTFRIEARCCKLFGLWLAGQFGFDAAASDAYAKDVVAANLDEAGFDDVKRKVLADIQKHGAAISAHMVDAQLEKFLAEARAQITAA